MGEEDEGQPVEGMHQEQRLAPERSGDVDEGQTVLVAAAWLRPAGEPWKTVTEP